ncbi:MAG: hypothetical protein AAGA85_12610, partial [Bacteroidota bacterium]
NDLEGLEQKRYPRAINRQKFIRSAIETWLRDASSINAQVLKGLREMITVRQQVSQFHPLGRYSFPPIEDGLLAIERRPLKEGPRLLAYFNLTQSAKRLQLSAECNDLMENRSKKGEIELHAYDFVWLLEGS